jgi:hypothetical protein
LSNFFCRVSLDSEESRLKKRLLGGSVVEIYWEA